MRRRRRERMRPYGVRVPMHGCERHNCRCCDSYADARPADRHYQKVRARREGRREIAAQEAP